MTSFNRWGAFLSVLSLTLATGVCRAQGDPSPADGSIALVIAARGDVAAVDTEGVPRALSVKDPIFLGETVRTGQRGRAQVSFTDGTIISLGRGTVVELAEYAYNPDDEAQCKLTTKVSQGIFRVMGGAINRLAPDRFKTVTPSATIGVRGSFFLGQLIGERLTVVFLGGIGIDVYNALGKTELTRASYGCVVAGVGEKPGRRKRFDQRMMRPLLGEFSFGPAATGEGTDKGGRSQLEEPRGSAEPEERIRTARQIAGTQETSNTKTTDGPPLLPYVPSTEPDPGPDPEPDEYAMEGWYLASQTAEDGSVDEDGWLRPAVATSTDGVVVGDAAGEDPAPPYFDFEISSNTLDPNGPHGTVVGPTADTRDLDINSGIHSISFLKIHDEPGQFLNFSTDGEPIGQDSNSADLLFADAGYVGLPTDALAMPTDGVVGYEGLGSVVADGADGVPAEGAGLREAFTNVNFTNGRVLGLSVPDESVAVENTLGPLFCIGTVAGNEITDIVMFGSGVLPAEGQSATPYAYAPDSGLFSGTGMFFGTDAQGVGWPAYGMRWDLAGNTQLDFAEAVSGGLDVRSSLPGPGTAPVTFEGYTAGVAESLLGGLSDAAILMNDSWDSSEFTMVVDRLTGTISGNLSVAEHYQPPGKEGRYLRDLSLGPDDGTGDSLSAYIEDDVLAAFIDDDNASMYFGADMDERLQDWGSFLVTPPKEDQFQDGGTPVQSVHWGVWEMAVVAEPVEGTWDEYYHLHPPLGYAVYGVPLDTADLAELTATFGTATVGRYTGGADLGDTSFYETATPAPFTGVADIDVFFETGNIWGELDFTANTGPLVIISATFDPSVSDHNWTSGIVYSVDGDYTGDISTMHGGFFHQDGQTGPAGAGGTFTVGVPNTTYTAISSGQSYGVRTDGYDEILVGAFGTDLASTGAPTVTTMNGLYQSALENPENSIEEPNYWARDVQAAASGGVITSTALAVLTDGAWNTMVPAPDFSFAFDARPPTDTPYTGCVVLQPASDRELSLLDGETQGFPYELLVGSRGEVVAFSAEGATVVGSQTGTRSFSEVGIVGTAPGAQAPVGRVVYEGPSLFTSDEVGIPNADRVVHGTSPGATAAVNFDNGKLACVFEPTQPGGPLTVVYGDLDDNTSDPAAAMSYLGSGVLLDSGKVDLLEFYGSEWQGLGMKASAPVGYVDPYYPPGTDPFMPAGDSDQTFALVQAKQDVAPATGVVSLTAFGVAHLSMPDGYGGQYPVGVVMNRADMAPGGAAMGTEELSLELDLANGVVVAPDAGGASVLSMGEAVTPNPSYSLFSEIGNSQKSAVPSERLFAAEMAYDDAGSGQSAGIVAASTPVVSGSGFLVTAPPAEQGSDETVWGYWAYVEQRDTGEGSMTYEIPYPAGLWVGGSNPTSQSLIDGLINDAQTTYSGYYAGDARLVSVVNGSIQPVVKGMSSLTVFLGRGNDLVSGTMDFSQSTAGLLFNVSGNVHSTGFDGVVTSAPDPIVGPTEFTGAFFGTTYDSNLNGTVPAAAAGSFAVETQPSVEETTRYIGVFDGKHEDISQ